MMPGLSLAVAAALGAGFSQIGTKLLDEGVIKPATQPAALFSPLDLDPTCLVRGR